MSKPEIYKTLRCSTAHIHPNVGKLLDAWNKALFPGKSLRGNSCYVSSDDLIRERWYETLTAQGITFIADSVGPVADALNHFQRISGDVDPRLGWRFKTPTQEEGEDDDAYPLVDAGGFDEIRDLNGDVYPMRDLLTVLDFAKELGCDYVQFEPDAPPLNGFTTYDWP